MGNETTKRDLVLNLGEYAYIQDLTRGMIKTYVGPAVINPSAQDTPVMLDPSKKRFVPCAQMEDARQICQLANEGEYIVLNNPSTDGKVPAEGSQSNSPVLNWGRKINIHGPQNIALWPGQNAQVVKGHNLRSNEYLVVRIYNDVEAKANWGKAVVKSVAPATTAPTTEVAAPVIAVEKALTIGQLLVIKGTEVSFYMPPTGVEVVADERGSYVRSAVTLERLEYAILIDENGNKRYERGPQVVFPNPTETFNADENGKREFDAIELNNIQGIHIKVIAPYTETVNGVMVERKEGDELFITGNDCAIYFPRPEHSIIQYGDRKKYYATAIPAGEGRYVMNRSTGEIKTVRGPSMLLPNPINEVLVRRILTDRQCQLWYPGNAEAIAYNHSLAGITETADERSGYVAENVYSRRLGASKGGMDSMQRGTSYTQPRQVTLNTKFEGVPAITIWTGYAVMVVDKRGNRRVEVGPKTILLDYDESLEVLELSTGKPKNSDNLQYTTYLRTTNNKVSDIIDVETKDHVPCQIKLSFRVNFEGPNEKWFDVENYVKFLTDHIRSVIKGSIRKVGIEAFYGNGVDIIRDIILGEKTEGKRAGMMFAENGMVIKDVEVLAITIMNNKVADVLSNAQHQIVTGNVDVALSENELKRTVRKEEINRAINEQSALTVQQKNKLEIDKANMDLNLLLTKIKSDIEANTKRKDAQIIKEEVEDVAHAAMLERKDEESKRAEAAAKAELDRKLIEWKAEVEGVVARFNAAQGGFGESLTALSNQNTLREVAQALSVQNFVGGQSFVDVVQKVFAGSNLGPVMEGVLGKAFGGTLTEKVVPSAKRV